MTDCEKPDGKKPDDEDGLALGWPEVDRTEEAETGLFVSDLELYRRLGVGPRTGRDAVRALESRGFPRKDPLFGNKRYWPAVRHFLDSLHGLAERRRYDHSITHDGSEAVPQRRRRPRPRLRAQN